MHILAYLGEPSIGKGVALRDFTGGPVVEDPPASIRDRGSFPGLGRVHIPRGNKACGHQYRCLPALHQEKPPP